MRMRRCKVVLHMRVRAILGLCIALILIIRNRCGLLLDMPKRSSKQEISHSLESFHIQKKIPKTSTLRCCGRIILCGSGRNTLQVPRQNACLFPSKGDLCTTFAPYLRFYLSYYITHVPQRKHQPHPLAHLRLSIHGTGLSSTSIRGISQLESTTISGTAMSDS